MITGVQVIIMKGDEVLIAKRAPFKKNGDKRIGANRWNLIGGKIDPGECPDETAFREVYEEAGLDLEKVIEVSAKINPWDPEYDPFYSHLFVTRIDHDQEVTLNDEHSEFKFVHPTALQEFDLLGYSVEEITEALTLANSYQKFF